MQSFSHLGYEIKINVFKYVDSPRNLALTCRNWSVIAKDPYAKSDWLIEHYGKEHALFHAIRLGPSFIDVPLCQFLIAGGAVISKDFIQELLRQFGKYDQKLVELKIDHSADQLEATRTRAIFQKNINSPLANLPLPVFTYLLTLGNCLYPSFKEESTPKGNNTRSLEPLHSSPVGTNKRFISLPPRPKIRLGLNNGPHNRQRSNSGYNSYRQGLRTINHRRRNRFNRRYVPANNKDTLARIAKLPQQVSNDPNIDQFFNGFRPFA